MAEISPLDLKEGITYRIVHRKGQIKERFGVFDVLLLENTQNENARFTNIHGENVRSFPLAAYRTDEWKFLKSVDPNDPQPLTDGGRRRRRKTKKSKRRHRKTRRSRK